VRWCRCAGVSTDVCVAACGHVTRQRRQSSRSRRDGRQTSNELAAGARQVPGDGRCPPGRPAAWRRRPPPRPSHSWSSTATRRLSVMITAFIPSQVETWRCSTLCEIVLTSAIAARSVVEVTERPFLSLPILPLRFSSFLRLPCSPSCFPTR